MRSPFPGMDPYLEDPAIWPDVHARLANAIGEQLGGRVGDRYWVGMERRVYIEYDDPSAGRVFVPDLVVVGSPAREVAPEARGLASHVVLEVPEPSLVEVREVYLVIRELPSRKVVTVLELLSPANKREGLGRQEYYGKRVEVLRTRTHLVELDLLRAGERMPVRGALPASHYVAMVHRGERRPKAEVYGWSVRDRFPRIAIPLLPEDADVELDLCAALQQTYERGRYHRVLDYGRPPEPPLSAEDAAWAAALCAARGG